MSDDVEGFRAGLDSDTLAAIDALRALVVAADGSVEERIKWNAPSFAKGGDDRITLGIERKGGVRAVLHRGAKPKVDDFSFDDPDRLAKWPAPDRGVLTFADADAVTAKGDALKDLFARWIAATV